MVGRETISFSRRDWPCTHTDPEDRAAFQVGTWTKFLDHPNVQSYIHGKLVKDGPSCYKLIYEEPKPVVIKKARDLTDDELRIQYRKYWSKNQTEFCKGHKINQGNFSSWLSGKRDSPASTDAVRCWLINSQIKCEL